MTAQAAITQDAKTLLAKFEYFAVQFLIVSSLRITTSVALESNNIVANTNTQQCSTN